MGNYYKIQNNFVQFAMPFSSLHTKWRSCRCIWVTDKKIFLYTGTFPRRSKTKNRYLNECKLAPIKRLHDAPLTQFFGVPHDKIFARFGPFLPSLNVQHMLLSRRSLLLFANRHLIYRYANIASFARVWERKCCIPSDVNHGVGHRRKLSIRVWRACVFDTCLFIELLSCTLKKCKRGERIV